MNNKKLKLKKFYLHPNTTFLILTILVMTLSGIFSIFELQTKATTITPETGNTTLDLLVVKNMFSYNGLQYIISNSIKNFLQFTPLSSLIVSMIGIAVAEASGLIETFTRRHLKKMDPMLLTFLVLLTATISSLINDVGYGLLIPLVGLVYFIYGRNPILGITTAFAGVAFGYGVSIFVGTMEVSLLGYTTSAARLIDKNYHLALTGNLFFIIAATLIISIVGTFIIEKIIAKKLGHYKTEELDSKTEEYRIIDLEEEEQKEIEKDRLETRGLKGALITSIIMLFIFVYSLLPGLPLSGMMLDLNEKTYLQQLFGTNAYFKDGFTYMVALYLIVTGLVYGIKSKTIKNDKEIIEKINNRISSLGGILLTIFIASQFINVFKETGLAQIITSMISNFMEKMSLTGIPLIIVSLVFIAIINIFNTSPINKWKVLAPSIVPVFMQANLSPGFAQIVMRAGLSMTNGFTPLLAGFSIYIGFLNYYNLNKNRPYGINKTLKLLSPYFIIISLTWIGIVIGWYILGLPLGMNTPLTV